MKQQMTAMEMICGSTVKVYDHMRFSYEIPNVVQDFYMKLWNVIK